MKANHDLDQLKRDVNRYFGHAAPFWQQPYRQGIAHAPMPLREWIKLGHREYRAKRRAGLTV